MYVYLSEQLVDEIYEIDVEIVSGRVDDSMLDPPPVGRLFKSMREAPPRKRQCLCWSRSMTSCVEGLSS